MDSRQLLPADSSSNVNTSNVSTLDSLDPSPNAKRSNVSTACEECRQRKQRCDGQKPCRPCLVAHKECNYFRKDRRRQHERNDSIQAEMETLQASMNILRFGSDRQAFKALQDLRYGMSEKKRFPVWEKERSPSASTNVSPRSTYTDTDDTTHSSAATYVTANTEAQRSPQQSALVFSDVNLPPKEIIEKGAGYFFRVMTNLVYIMDESEFLDSLAAVYNTPSSSSNIVDVAELCAIAAVGSYCDPSGLSDDVETLLFQSVLQNLNTVIDHDTIKALRCMSCLSLHGVMQKRRSTRNTIHTGLQVSRWSIEENNVTSDDQLRLRKLTRTLAFLECWSAASLGHDPGINAQEIAIIRGSSSTAAADFCELTRTKFSELGLLRAKVLTFVSLATFDPTQSTIEQLTLEMNAWYQSLPQQLAFATLTADNNHRDSVVQKGAPLLAHAIYLGTFILLHRRILAATAASVLGKEWQVYQVGPEQAEQFHHQCVDAARSTIRIFMLLDFGVDDSAIHTRCWLSAFEILTACTILLYDVTMKVANSTAYDSTVSEDLQRIKACLTLTSKSPDANSGSSDIHTALSSIQAQLESVSQSLEQKSARVSQTYESGDVVVKTLTTRAIEIVVKILHNPFGRNKDDTSSVSSEPNSSPNYDITAGVDG